MLKKHKHQQQAAEQQRQLANLVGLREALCGTVWWYCCVLHSRRCAYTRREIARVSGLSVRPMRTRIPCSMCVK